MAMESGQVIAHYRLVERLGEGGMGAVWKAEDTILGRTVALKVLPPDAARDEERRRMLFEEARLAASLGHANIAQIFEFGRDGERDFIAMEYVEGKSLADILHGRPLPPDQVVRLGAQIATGVSRAHRKGLLHRDLKPANIMVTPDGDVKVVDFGLATLFERRDSTWASQLFERTETVRPGTEPPARAEPGVIAGTIPYMSPEQLHGEPLDARSDVFSLGSVLYEMVAGQRPFMGATTRELVAEIQKGQPEPPHVLAAKMPLDLERIVLKALASRPADRYQTMDDLAVDLQRLGRELDSGSSPSFADLRKAAPQPSSRRRNVVLTALLLAVAVLGTLVVVRRTNGPPGADAATSLMIAPFEVRGQAEGAEYAGQALAEAIAVGLSPAKNLRVLPVPGTQELPSGTAERTARAHAAGANRLLVGALVRDEGTAQVTLSLVDVQQNRIVWGTRRDADYGELQELAGALVRDLVAQMGARFERVYTTSQEFAGQADLVGSRGWTETLGALARSEAARAAEASASLVRDFPREPEAWLLRAQALIVSGRVRLSPAGLEEVMRALGTVQELDPQHPRVEQLGLDARRIWGVMSDLDDHNRALTGLLARSDLSPALRAAILFSRYQRNRNEDPESERSAFMDLEEAARLVPASPRIFDSMSEMLDRNGRLEEALSRAQQAVALDPFDPAFRNTLGYALCRLGRASESIEPFRYSYEKRHSMDDILGLARGLALAGRTAEAQRIASEAHSFPETALRAYQIACYLAVAGDRRGALQQLRRSLDLGWTSPWLGRDPDFASLHGDPEFEALVAELEQRRRRE